MVWPLFHLNAEWGAASYAMGHGLSLARLNSKAKEYCADMENHFWNICYTVGLAYRDLNWVAVIDIPEATQPVPLGAEGHGHHIPRFEDHVARVMIPQFLRSVRLVKPSACIAPESQEAEFDDDGAVSALFGVEPDPAQDRTPSRSHNERLGEDDLGEIGDLWDALYRLFDLGGLRRKVFDEGWFASIDEEAMRRTKEFYAPLVKQAGEMPQDIRDFLNLGEDFGTGESSREQQMWAQEFSRIFSQKVDDLACNESRLGRAVTIFDDGLVLPSRLHSFLAMFLVLETLFNTEPMNVTHKIAVRATRILHDFHPPDRQDEKLPSGLNAKRELYKTFADLYRTRSNVIHGSVSFSEVSDKDVERTEYLARQCLHTALLNRQLFDLFSHPQTAGKKLNKLRDFFRGLELGEAG